MEYCADPLADHGEYVSAYMIKKPLGLPILRLPTCWNLLYSGTTFPMSRFSIIPKFVLVGKASFTSCYSRLNCPILSFKNIIQETGIVDYYS